jgi:hypothetical protein
MKALEELGRTRLSKSFFLRDFLHSEIANFYGIPNIPHDPDMAIKNGKMLCETCWFSRGTEPVFSPRSEPPLSMVF